MTFLEKLAKSVEKNNSLLCVGLDPVIERMPAKLKGDPTPFLTFNKAIIDATVDLVCAYKPNSAFYEALGPSGLEQLQQTIRYINEKDPQIPTILDAKRADIGSTNEGYIDYIFDYLGMDAVTLHPYLGKEALQPFLDLKDKGLIILCRTSNPGVEETQDVLVDGRKYYQYIAGIVSKGWDGNKNCLLVVGATYPEEMKEIRQIVGNDMIFLVPGVGAQGGDIEQAVKAGVNSKGTGMIINSARGIIFASEGDDFAEAARSEAQKTRDEINKHR